MIFHDKGGEGLAKSWIWMIRGENWVIPKSDFAWGWGAGEVQTSIQIYITLFLNSPLSMTTNSLWVLYLSSSKIQFSWHTFAQLPVLAHWHHTDRLTEVNWVDWGRNENGAQHSNTKNINYNSIPPFVYFLTVFGSNNFIYSQESPWWISLFNLSQKPLPSTHSRDLNVFGKHNWSINPATLM